MRPWAEVFPRRRGLREATGDCVNFLCKASPDLRSAPTNIWNPRLACPVVLVAHLLGVRKRGWNAREPVCCLTPASLGPLFQQVQPLVGGENTLRPYRQCSG